MNNLVSYSLKRKREQLGYKQRKSAAEQIGNCDNQDFYNAMHIEVSDFIKNILISKKTTTNSNNS